MAGIPVHHTKVDSTSAWDKSRVVADTKAELRYVSAWVDDSADPALKGSYKFPHHYKDGGPAILKGVNNAKARLPNAKIPEADRAGVEAHLNAHQDDAKQSVLAVIQAWFEKLAHILDGTAETTEQAISMPNVYSAVAYELNQMSSAPGPNGGQPDGKYRALIDCYLDGPDIFAVIGMEGKLYKSLITLIPGGNLSWRIGRGRGRLQAGCRAEPIQGSAAGGRQISLVRFPGCHCCSE